MFFSHLRLFVTDNAEPCGMRFVILMHLHSEQIVGALINIQNSIDKHKKKSLSKVKINLSKAKIKLSKPKKYGSEYFEVNGLLSTLRTRFGTTGESNATARGVDDLKKAQENVIVAEKAL